MSTWTLKENSTGELVAKVEGDVWTKACDKAFNKIAKTIELPGFRKGKAPRKMLEKRIPRQQVYYEAVDAVANDVLQAEVKANNLELVARPELDLGTLNDECAELIFKLTVKPEVKLGEYKGLDYNMGDTTVTDEDFDKEINRMREQYSDIVTKEGPAAMGDTVNIDYKGFKGEEPFEGGSAEGYKLVLGSGSFIPGFEEQLVGVKAGEEKELNLKFPEDYHAEDLAGADVVFKVKVNEVTEKVLPELDDDFAQDVNAPGVETVEDLKALVRKRLEDSKKQVATREADEDLFRRVSDNAEVNIPDVMIEDEIQNHVQQLQSQLQQYNMSLTGYLQMMGQTAEQFKESFREESEKSVKMRLVLEAIGKAENLELTEEEIEKEYQNLSEMYQMPVERVKELVDRDMLMTDIRSQKAYDFVKKSAKGVPEEEPETPAEAPAEAE